MPSSPRDRADFVLQADSAPESKVIHEDEPFRIALLGDFSGRSDRAPLSQRKPVLVDRDNFEAVLEKLEVGVDLSTGRIAVTDIDHFGPDHIYRTHPVFKRIRDIRERLADPETFPEAAHDLLGETPAPLPPGGAGSLLDQIVGESAAAARPARPKDDLQKIIDQAIRPYLVARQDPRAPELIRQVDEAASDLIRAILHHRSFQSVEAAWRTVLMMVRQLETGPDLKIYLIDVTKEELYNDPDAVYDLLVNRSGPWAVLAANYAFGAEECPLLTVVGTIAAKAGAPFLGEADLSLIGDQKNWPAFRRSPEARWIGLALPRVLLRLPWGKQTVACEAFDFEEVKDKPDARQMTFGSPAYLAAMLLGEAFEAQGKSMRPGSVRDIKDLPVYSYKENGDMTAFPTAEIALTEDLGLALIDAGFMPFAAIRNSDTVRVLMFQSVAEPAAPLPGRWS